jgi:hypothetical protein
MNKWERGVDIFGVVVFMCLLMSCIPLGRNTMNDQFISEPLPREANLMGDKCAVYLRTVRPNITAKYFLREGNDLRDSDILSAFVCAAPAVTNVLITYKGSDESWLSRHACSNDDRFLKFLDKKPSMYDVLVHISNSLGITPYCLHVDGVWNIFLFDMVSGEEREDYIPSSASYLPLESIK